MMKLLLILLMFVATVVMAREPAPQEIRIAFYNLENLFDTISNPEISDWQYTPKGTNQWTAYRYNRKISNLAKVIDQMSADVLGVCEIENENTLRDLVRALKTDYNYIHRTSNNDRGIDIALLYKADKFTPTKTALVHSSYTREFLHVRGMLLKQEVDFVVCHLPSNFNSASTRQRVIRRLAGHSDSIQINNNFAKVVLMGDFNANPTDKIMKQVFENSMFNPFMNMQRRGMGTYVFNDRWVLFDNIMINKALVRGNELRYSSCGIFIQEYMISSGIGQRRGYPIRTFVSGKYLGGYSDHLPVYLILNRY